ncbi:MAG: replication-relaxation family protein [Candidatus Microthrix sp.]|nr:replication-relaxation family protein [Candidatus Microthrix sp.]
MEPSGRDLAVLRDVGRLGHTSADQLRRLHFAEGSEVGRRRRAQAALRRLTDDGYLHRLPRRVGGTGSGSAGFVYCLGYRGQRLVFPVLFPGRRARTPEEVGTSFVGHSLAVAELVVGLVEAKRDQRCSELVLEAEPSCWRNYLGLHGAKRSLRPDMGVRLSVAGRQLVWFVEVDRGTEGLRQIRAKGRQYLEYWRTGQEQQRLGGVFPKVLWSVPDRRRQELLLRTLGELPPPAGEMFVVSTAEGSAAVLVGEEVDEEAINGTGGEGT